MVDIFECHTSHPIFQARAPLSLAQLKKGGINYHFQGTMEKKKTLTKTLLAGNLLFICNCICQWYDAENLVLTTRRSEEAEEIDVDAERNVPQARSGSLLRLTENHETLIRSASEQAAHSRMVENGQLILRYH